MWYWSLHYEQTKIVSLKKVLMTGFGPFAEIETNPSWEGVKAMDTEKIENKYNTFLFKKRIPVRYAYVDQIVPQLLDCVQPDLTIHVGVNAGVSCFVLEKRACRKGYSSEMSRDVDKRLPANFQNLCDGPFRIDTDLEVGDICCEFNRDPPGDDLRAKVSNNAGRHLCNYIYYTSLYHGRCPTLFVHVPFEKYKPEQLAQGLERILELCLKQIDENTNMWFH